MKRQDTQDEKIRVHIDPDLQDLIPDYLKSREKDLAIFQQALEDDNFDTIALLGHSMKGSGGGYGFNDLSNFGRAIEKAAKEKDKKSVQQSLIDLTDFLKKLEVVYD